MAWQKLASATWSSGSTFGTGTFVANKFLMIIVTGYRSGSDTSIRMQFNSDTTDGNYAYRSSQNGGSEATDTSREDSGSITPEGTDHVRTIVNVVNIATEEKLCMADGMLTIGNCDPPQRKEIAWKWLNTSAQITSVQILTESYGAFEAGSEVTVYGSDGTVTPAVYPNLSNGTIFEESDTGKHYMFDGTDTWNEIT